MAYLDVVSEDDPAVDDDVARIIPLVQDRLRIVHA